METTGITMYVSSLFTRHIKQKRKFLPKSKNIKIPVNDYIEMSQQVEQQAQKAVEIIKMLEERLEKTTTQKERFLEQFRLLMLKYHQVETCLSNTQFKLEQVSANLKKELKRPGKPTKDERKEFKELRTLQHKREKKIENTDEFKDLKKQFDDKSQELLALDLAHKKLILDWQELNKPMNLLAQALTLISKYKDRKIEEGEGELDGQD